MMTDPISDMLTRIRNASLVHKKQVLVPFSRLKESIAEILVREGYLTKVEEVTNTHPALMLTLRYTEGIPAIQNLKRVSTPGHRHYIKKDAVKRILNGFGIAIISTPRGLLTNTEAHKAGVGGEVICEVY